MTILSVSLPPCSEQCIKYLIWLTRSIFCQRLSADACSSQAFCGIFMIPGSSHLNLSPHLCPPHSLAFFFLWIKRLPKRVWVHCSLPQIGFPVQYPTWPLRSLYHKSVPLEGKSDFSPTAQYMVSSSISWPIDKHILQIDIDTSKVIYDMPLSNGVCLILEWIPPDNCSWGIILNNYLAYIT